jgi:hypothetical protein
MTRMTEASTIQDRVPLLSRPQLERALGRLVSRLAVQLGGAASSLRAQLHQPLEVSAEVMLEQRLAPARLALTVDEQARAWAEGQRMTSDQVIAAALRNTSVAR